MRLRIFLQDVSVGLGTVPGLSFFFKVCLDAEQQAVQLACSRLQELSCKWEGCSVKMNSVDALIRHLNRQHKLRTSHSNVCLSLLIFELRSDLTATVLCL